MTTQVRRGAEILKYSKIKNTSTKNDKIITLKGPKHEKFVAGIVYTNQTYMEIGELETRPKTSKIIGWCHIVFIFIVKKICLAMSATVLHIFF
jgi:hypothetical protein